MSKKSAQIAALVADCEGQDLDARYLGYFKCFNGGLFYEAHDVLEDLWLQVRRADHGDYYKGLIQLAGAFVHLQKDRLKPAAALFKLARVNLEKYPQLQERLDLARVRALIGRWLNQLEAGQFELNPLQNQPAPALVLEPVTPS